MLTPVEEIKQRLDIVDFIASHVQMKKAGANWKGRCPFHSEKTPSFMVSRAKQIWHCFGCNTGGDIIGFLMKIDGLEFPDALRLLAQKAGIQLPQYDPQINTLRQTVIAILDAAKDFFAKSLNTEQGKLAKSYLIKRGLDEATIKLFDLGYALNSWDALSSELLKKFKASDIFSAGLIVRKETSGSAQQATFYDRFRHRLMFPIRDVHGNVVGFTGRILDENQTGGKYVNTPETLVYNKSRVLYGLDLAKNAIRENDLAVIMEGNMDVVAAHQFGFQNTIASSGTALTRDQLKLIKRYTNNIALAFDADPAGQAAAKRGVDLAIEDGMRVRIIEIPAGAGKDPDDCIRKNKALWSTAIEQAKEVIEWYFKKTSKAHNLETASGRSNFVQIVMPEIARLPSLIEQDFWLKKIAERLNISQAILDHELKKQKTGVCSTTAPVLEPTVGKIPRRKLLEDNFLSLIFFKPDLLPSAIDRLGVDLFSDPQAKDLYIKLIAYYNKETSHFDIRKFEKCLAEDSPDLSSYFNIRELQGSKDFDGWSGEKVQGELKFIVSSIKYGYFKERRMALSREMKEAEARGDQAKISEITMLFEELNAKE